jgi:hypothetical protein
MGDYRPDSKSYGARLQLTRDAEKKRQIPEAKPRSEVDTAAGHMGATLPPLSQPGTLSPSLARDSLNRLQRNHGNQYVQRLLQRSGDGGGEVTPEVERAIESSRSGGAPLDNGIQSRMGRALNADFSGVRVHTGTEADSLNRSLGARAFTSGRDVYFRRGEYNPATSGGRELLAHELTHVVQQNGEKVQAKLRVGSTNDIYEQEADNVAKVYRQWEQQVGAGEGSGVMRQEVEEEEEKSGQEQTRPDKSPMQQQVEEKTEEEEMAQAKRLKQSVQRIVEEEEKEKEPGVQTKPFYNATRRPFSLFE